MDVDLVVSGSCPFRPAVHSWQHVTSPLTSEFRTARIERWGISATRPRGTHGHTGYFVGVTELAWWSNS